MKRASLLGALVLGLTLGAWVFSLASGYDVVADVDVARASQTPSVAHLLGTDHLGRDVARRLIAASEAFVGPGLLAAAVATLTGGLGGTAAGWWGGPVALALRYGFTVVASIPRFVLVLLACAIYGNEVGVIALFAGLAYAPALAEAVFIRLESFRQAEFVLAARAHGVPAWRVLLYHLLWVNCRGLFARHALQVFAFLLLVESTLSYIGGFGVSEPQPSWGNMIAFEWGVRDGNLWAAAAPALALWSVLLGASLLAEAVGEGPGG
ncbi:MAG: ABC transporter permease subunit [Alphaproteobacteria bacterium]|nr:ABC transporter permease subunit [Alphaproteobacteria bacterium]